MTTTNTAALVGAARARIEHLDPSETARQVADGALLVDLREIGEIEASGVIAGAIHVPRGILEFAADPSTTAHRAELDRARRTIVYCESGGRSALAVTTLRQLGFADVAHLDGGIRAWVSAGRSTELLR